MRSIWIIFGILVFLAAVLALDNGLGRTPQMGWSTWNFYGCNVNEQVVMTAARAMVDSGLAAVGYEYVNLDDCWASYRLPNGTIVADNTTFPSGIKALADYVHSLGLKFGIYTCAGTETCAGRPGSAGYEHIDADTYASWGVDYVKEDWCHTSLFESPRKTYAIMRDALNSTGRPMFFSLCDWGVDFPWEWGMETGNSWRTTIDIKDNWDSMLHNLDGQIGLAKYAGPGGWNDPDMLEVGNGGMTTTEYISHFSLWSILAAPLIAGNDLTNMSADTLEILTNREVIAVDQDPLGIPGDLVEWDIFADTQVWARPLSQGRYAAVLLNRSGETKSITLKWDDIGLSTDETCIVRDLWLHVDIGTFTGEYTADAVPSHGVAMVVLTPQ